MGFIIRGRWKSNRKIKALQACNLLHHGILNAKKIILKLYLFMQSLKKIGKEMPKIESEKTVYNANKGPLLCTYLSKCIHLQCQDTTFQYQLSYPVSRKTVKNAKNGK